MVGKKRIYRDVSSTYLYIQHELVSDCTTMHFSSVDEQLWIWDL